MVNEKRFRIFLLGITLVYVSPMASASEFFMNLKGCFAVSFEYIEDGKNNQYIDSLYEWVTPLENDPETSLQHIGIVGGEAFKHWREEWQLSSDGVWNQKVIGPSGKFRYECSAPMTFNQWRCTAKNAPKPRRDLHRSDYETLDRENTLQVTPVGWIQAENNVKRNKDGVAISNELGWNKYKRVDETYCKVAKEFIARNPNP